MTRKSIGAARRWTARKRTARRSRSSEKAVTASWEMNERQERQRERGLGPYESRYDVSHGYTTERAIILIP